MVCWYTLQHRWALETCRIKEARHEDHTRFQLQEMSQTGKSIDTESRLGVAREQGAGGVGSDREQVPVTLWGWWECSGSKSGGVHTWGFLGGSVVKNMSASEADTRDTVSVPGLGRSIHWRRNGSPLQYSCLENPMGRGAWWTMVHGVTRVGHDSATKPTPPPPSHPQLGIFPTKEGNCSRQHGRPYQGSNFPTRPWSFISRWGHTGNPRIFVSS